MPPRTNPRRNDAQQSEDYRELGKVGRKTGIGLPDLGARDEHGLAPIDGLFSSPEKGGTPNGRDDATQGAMDMDLESDAPPGPMSVMRGRHNLLPRGTSPRKTNMASPAIRNPHVGRSSSPMRGTIVSSESPPQNRGGANPVARKLDYGSPKTNGTRSKGPKATGLSRLAASPDGDEGQEEEPEDESILHGHDNPQAVDGGDESLQMVDDAAPAEASDPDVSVTQPDADKSSKSQPPKRKAGRPKKNKAPEPEPEPESEPEPEPEPEPESEPHDSNDLVAESGSDDADPVPVPKKKGRPPKNQTKAKENQTTARKPGKRERSGENPPGDQSEEEDNRASKKQRVTAKPTKSTGRGRPPKATRTVEEPTITGPAEEEGSKTKAKGGKRGRPRASDVGNDSNVGKVQKGPPLPKSRGLYALKHQRDNTITTTRSGRHSYRPLDYWKNERVVQDDEGVWEDATAHGQKHDRFLLPSIKEVIRVEDEEPEPAKRRGYNRPRATSSKAKKHVVEEEQEPPEPWEVDEGRIEGETIVWDPDYEVNPPAPDEPVGFENNEIAVAQGAIQTREIRDATFRFAKLLSLPFFGAGVVDLPPGTEKKPKNSRKNQMTFFVHYGKVLVTVNETQFRISAGGFWNVPRGNYYNILNDYDQPARLFFSQGNEVMISEPEGRADAE